MMKKKVLTCFLFVILLASLFLSFDGQCSTLFESTSNSSDSIKYIAKEVSIPAGDGNPDLSGILTIPKSIGEKDKVVILVSPPQVSKCDYSFFSELSTYLSRRGIAVLRFDGKTYDPLYTSMHTRAEEVEYAIAFLKNMKEFRNIQLGLIGHSEGGCSSVIVSSRNDDIDFLVLLSTAGISGREHSINPIRIRSAILHHFPAAAEDTMLLNQIVKSATDEISIYADIVSQEYDMDIIKERMKEECLRPQWEKERPPANFESYCEFSFHSELYSNKCAYLVRYNPLDYLPKVQVPVLAIFGSKDWVVNPDDNLNKLKEGLEQGDNNQVTAIEIEGMNHDYQIEDEVPLNDGKMSVEALQTISNWIGEL